MSDTRSSLPAAARNRWVEAVAAFVTLWAALALLVVGVGVARADADVLRAARPKSSETSSLLPCAATEPRPNPATGAVKGWPHRICGSPAQS
ncbi:hypothetical protein GCM10023335_72760 [Streptomyces siamensis]|uniref:Secreted protein n=1 Tax=Streptomyces siamensis TaxID=1274986 RepID=A0ABP9JGJ8_9ACTN